MCTDHKTDGMRRIKPYICQETRCNKGAYFNYKEEKQRLYCGDHKKANMIRLDKKTCKEANCYVEPTYGTSGGSRLYCSKHKKDNMVVLHKKQLCQEKDCETMPSFNYLGIKTGLYCKQHSKPQCLQKHLTTIPEKEVTVEHLFYNEQVELKPRMFVN
jgi:hypothetical protein